MTVFGAQAQEVPELTEDHYSAATSISTRQFGYDGLWGYINGGADLYLEYGFEHVTAQEISINNSLYKADIYRMQSPEAAFGIFSVSRFRCRESGVLVSNDCSTPYQYIAASGNYYLSVANATGTVAEQKTGLEIAGIILNQIIPSELHVPDIFHSSLFEESMAGLKFVKGPLGLQNGFIRWDNMFSGLQTYEAWILPFNYQDDQGVLALVQFSDNNSRQIFLKQNGLALSNPLNLKPDSNKTLTAFEAGRSLIIYEGPLSEPVLKMLCNSLN